VIGAALALTGVIGLTVLARCAAAAAAVRGGHTFVLGAVLGGVTILTESGGDFALHIPGVAVTVVILCAHLSKLGLEAQAHGQRVPGANPNRTVLGVLNLVAFPCLSLVVLIHGIALARSEAACRASGRFAPGNSPLPGTAEHESREDLERARAALEAALVFRPDWAEGHQQLGLTLLKLYQVHTAEELRSTIADPAERAVAASPLWLHAQLHAHPASAARRDLELLASETVRTDLIPAAREFLEARRCCPVLPIPHAELASLDYLLKGGDCCAVMTARAFRLAGSNAAVISLCGQLALQADDAQLLSQILKKRLASAIGGWEDVAVEASLVFAPEQIFSEIVPSGRLAVLIAGYLYASPANRASRDQFLRAAIERLPSDPTLSPAERAYWEARAWELIGNRDQAGSRMLEALALEPGRALWRRELVEWYLRWSRPRDAHEQALIGLQMAPTDLDSHHAWELSVDALARAEPEAPP
jgi:hypothetical protein